MTAASHQPPYQALVRACIKHAAAQGAALMQRTLARALQELPAAAAAEPDIVERNLLAQAADLLREQQAALVELFPQALLAELAQVIAGDRGSALGFDSLPLLGEEQVQDNMQVLRAGRQLQAAVAPQLEELEALLTAAQGGGATGPARHALRPDVYVRALYRLVRQSPVAAGARRRWLRHLAQAMGPELAEAYLGLSALLRDHGVSLAPAASPPPARGPGETQLTIRQLQGLLASGPGAAAGAGQRPGFAETEFAATVPAAFEMLQELRKVDQLVQQLRQRQAAMPGSDTDNRAAFRAALHEQARLPAQRLGLEVVHLLVEHLAGDERLLPPVRDAVRDLEPVLLRLALADPRFFSDRDHPARQLLEQSTQRSLGWASVDAPGFAEFIEGLQQAVEVLLETRAAGPAAFDIALRTLRESWVEVQPRGRRRWDRAMRTLMRAEQRNLLAERFAREIRALPDARDAPAEALAFLTGPWAQVLAQAHLTDRSGAADPGGYRWVVQAVLWSVNPVRVKRLGNQGRQLVERIQAGLTSIDHQVADTRRWQALLADLRVAAASQALGEPVGPLRLEPPPALADTWLAPLELYDSGFLPDLPGEAAPDPAADPQVGAQLQPGAWVDMRGDTWERWQLAWSSPHGLLFMFTQGDRTRSMTHRRLQHMLAEGSLRLVSPKAMVDLALDAVARAAWQNSITGDLG